MVKYYSMVFFRKIYNKYSDKVRFLRHRKIIREIKNKNLSIISSDCLGGILYHDFKKEFTSPTINLYFSESNYSFLNFCLDPEFYLEKELEFIESDSFPKAIIKGDKSHQDVNINFMHYKNQQEALDCWKRRSDRLLKNKVFIYLKFKLDELDMKLIDKINNIIVITSNKSSEEFCANKKVLVSKHLSKLVKNDGRIMSYSGLFGKRNFDDLKLFELVAEEFGE